MAIHYSPNKKNIRPKKKETIAQERKRKSPGEILKLCGVLEEVDVDVADVCMSVVPKDGKLISLADLTKKVQAMKYKWKKEVLNDIERDVLLHKNNDKFIYHSREQRKKFDKLKKKHLSVKKEDD